MREAKHFSYMHTNSPSTAPGGQLVITPILIIVILMIKLIIIVVMITARLITVMTVPIKIRPNQS